MARVSLDSEMFGDTRFVFLAQLLGMADPDTARMKCARVWHECTLRGRAGLSEATIDVAAGIPGFAQQLIAAELARPQKGLIYVCGTRGRIEWFQDKKRAGKLGGEATRQVWKEKKALGASSDSQHLTEGHAPKGVLSDEQSAERRTTRSRNGTRKVDHRDQSAAAGMASDSQHLHGGQMPSATARAVARPSSSPPSPLLPEEEELTTASSFTLVPPAPAEPKPGTLLKAAFEGWFAEQYGSTYAWSAKEGKHAKELMGRAGELGVLEVLRRAAIAASQDWRTETVTLGSLVSGWNGLSVAVVQQKLTPQERADIERARRVNGEAP